MKRLLASRRRMVAACACAAVAVVIAAGYGYAAITATNQVYTGCLQGGDISNVNVGPAPLKACPKTALQISWSQTGPPGQDGTNGKDGVSVTSAAEPPGANCAEGGSKFTAANDNVTYACNGDKGDPGSSNLAALQGSPCTFNGHPSTLQVGVSGTTGLVSMVCNPLWEVSASVSGGTMTVIDLKDLTVGDHIRCTSASSCTRLVQRGHYVQVVMESGDVTNGGGSSFTYACPDESPHPADPGPNPGYFEGSCTTPFLGIPVGDYAVAASFDS